MRILLLHHFPLWGNGSGTFVRNLSRELSEKHRIGISCPDQTSQINKKNIKLFPTSLPFPTVFLTHPVWTDAKKYEDLTEQEIYFIYRRFLKSTISAVEKFKPHIIHIQHIAAFAWVAHFIKNLYGIPYIITTHGTDLLTISDDPRYKPLGQEACRGASAITAVSPDTRDWLLDIFGNSLKQKTTIIPGGVDVKNFPKTIGVSKIKKQLHLQGKPIVLFTGRLTPMKGVKYLVQAAKNIKGEVLIVGGGPEEEPLKKLALKHKIDNIHFLGYYGKNRAKGLKSLYYAADVFVAPSVWDEPLGLVILEAMAARTPVVVTRKGGIPLAVKNGYNGFFVPPRNSASIATAVNKILKNKKMAQRLGNNARVTVEERFDWPTIAIQFEEIYAKYASK